MGERNKANSEKEREKKEKNETLKEKKRKQWEEPAVVTTSYQLS